MIRQAVRGACRTQSAGCVRLVTALISESMLDITSLASLINYLM
jgi:hypothetical protein